MLCVKNRTRNERRTSRFRVKSEPKQGHRWANIFRSPWTTVPVTQAFNSTTTIAIFIRFISNSCNSHIHSIHQQETEIHLKIHAYQSLHLLLRQLRILTFRPTIQAFIRFDLATTNLLFDSTHIKNSEKINKTHSNYGLRRPNSQRLTCHADMAFGRGK